MSGRLARGRECQSEDDSRPSLALAELTLSAAKQT